MPQQLKAASIQKHLEIKEIKDDVIILKNGGLRSILMATSINFALRSTEEQNAIVYRYQSFLNSLDFSLQILAVSRKFNIDPYIESLEKGQSKQENELLKIHSSEYIDFVKGLTQMTNIMTESFYIVVPYSSPITKKVNFLSKLMNKDEESKSSDVNEENFQALKNNLWQRVEFINSGMRSMGIKTVPLNTEELIELFYKLYNPSAKENPELQKAQELRNQ